MCAMAKANDVVQTAVVFEDEQIVVVRMPLRIMASSTGKSILIGNCGPGIPCTVELDGRTYPATARGTVSVPKAAAGKLGS